MLFAILFILHYFFRYEKKKINRKTTVFTFFHNLLLLCSYDGRHTVISQIFVIEKAAKIKNIFIE
jgi:hypothetical protein